MADNLRNTCFIEFYGAPGSGKSTVSHIVANNLRKEGFKVYEPSYSLDHSMSSLLRRMLKFCVYLYYCFLHHKTFISVVSLVKKAGYCGWDVLFQCSNVFQKLLVYNRKRINYDYVIWDQGIVQAAVSISVGSVHDMGKSADYTTINVAASIYYSNLMKYVEPDKDVRYFYLKIDSVESIRRLEGRKQEGSRVEKLSDNDEKVRMVEEFIFVCNVLNKNIPYTVVIDGNDGIGEIISVIGKYL